MDKGISHVLSMSILLYGLRRPIFNSQDKEPYSFVELKAQEKTGLLLMPTAKVTKNVSAAEGGGNVLCSILISIKTKAWLYSFLPCGQKVLKISFHFFVFAGRFFGHVFAFRLCLHKKDAAVCAAGGYVSAYSVIFVSCVAAKEEFAQTWYEKVPHVSLHAGLMLVCRSGGVICRSLYWLCAGCLHRFVCFLHACCFCRIRHNRRSCRSS